MPTDLAGAHVFRDAKLMYAPGKAANAGGVAVSGLEMSQNSERRSWSEGELQQMLQDIMAGIHARCLTYGEQSGGYVEYVKGANIAGFKKVADAMLAFGVVSAPIGPPEKGGADRTKQAGQGRERKRRGRGTRG